ncbi:MAG: hypothetical protein AB8V41_05675 [Francisella endosymbiont of Hyalomma asiaticum]
MANINQQTILITDANRGISLGFIKYYLEQNYIVIATCRAPSEATEL